MIEKIEQFARQSLRNPRLKSFLGNAVYSVLPKQGRIAIASFPRSGNTWMRVLIENATSELTGSIYKNDGIHSRASTGIVVKTHARDSFRYEKAIFLVRNPFDSIESGYAFWKNYMGNTDLVWEDHVNESLINLKSHTQHWQNAKCELLLIKYEDLLSDPTAALKRTCQFLDKEIADEKIKQAIEASALDKMKSNSPEKGKGMIRRGKKGLGIDNFSQEQIAFVERELSTIMKSYQYFSS